MFLMAAVVVFFAASTVSAQSVKSYKFGRSTLQPGQSLQPGEGLMSPQKKYAFVMQSDGNLCLYKLTKDSETPVKCTMTIEGSNKGARLDMQQDGNLVLHNADGKPIWASGTYKGNDSQKGRHIWMSDFDGKALQMTAKDGKSYIWNFEG